jgi:hypothetical protein
MRITIATLIAFFTVNIVCAQTDTFMVKSVSTTVTVVPNDSWFHVREDYPVKITFKSKNKMSRVELKGGTATKKDSVWVLRAETGGEAVLVIYEKLPNGKEQVALSKSYKLFGRELPEVTVDFVKNDSVVDKMSLIALGKLRAKTKYGQQVFRVDSFCMYIRDPKNGGMDTFYSRTGQMTLEMKRRVDSIDVKKSGGMIMFDNIHSTSPEGKDVELPPLRVFLSPESRLRFGL